MVEYDKVYLKRKVKELSKRTTEPNVRHLLKFIDERQDLSEATKLSHIRFVLAVNSWVDKKDILEFNENDLVKLNSKLHNGNDWGWNNKDTLISKFRAFSRWVLGLTSKESLPRHFDKLVRPNPKLKPIDVPRRIR